MWEKTLNLARCKRCNLEIKVPYYFPRKCMKKIFLIPPQIHFKNILERVSVLLVCSYTKMATKDG